MLFQFLILVRVCVAFPLKCPEPAQWSLRARSHCPDPSKYFCLKNDIINGYSENCIVFDFLQPGRKSVLRGGLDADICSSARFQPWPLKFFTNVSTNCIFLKSTCHEEGQVIHDNGTRNVDKSCRCDYTRGYDFLIKPRNPCFCVPSKEDCSCYLKKCPKSTDKLSADYECLQEERNLTILECNTLNYKTVNITSSKHISEYISRREKKSNKVLTKVALSAICFGMVVFFCIGLCTDELLDRYYRPFFFITDYFIGKTDLRDGQSAQIICQHMNNKSIAYIAHGNSVLIRNRQNIQISEDGRSEVLEITNVGLMYDRGFIEMVPDKNINQTELLIHQMPEFIKKMSARDRKEFLTAANYGTANRYYIRVMIIGEKSAGKTSLLRRLMKEPLTMVKSTDGIDIERRKCQVNVNTGEWHFSTPIDKPFSLVKGESKVFADCRFWDFAGQKEFYATHQTFLNPNAVYLLVVDVSTDFTSKTPNDMLDKEFETSGEYIDFWFDNIHCYSTEQGPRLYNQKVDLNPPIIIVGTGIDKIPQDAREEKMREFNEHLCKILSTHDKRRHLRKVHFLSNKFPSKKGEEFDFLRQDILLKAQALCNWGDNLPTRWIVFENEIFKKISADKFTMSYEEAKKLATKCSFPDVKETTSELDSFLKYEHDIGNIIFFEDVKEFIVLDPKWLVDIFRCVVSHKYKPELINMTEWSELEQSGKLMDNLIVNLLDKMSSLCLTTHKSFILQIMEKFDIIVRPLGDESKKFFHMPCMIKSVNLNDIVRKIGGEGCKKTSWFCLQFDFLPPSYFNHILVSFVKKKELRVERDNRLGIYRNVGIFNINSSGSEVIVFCLSKNSIAMQVWQWNCKEHVCYSDLKNNLMDIVKLTKGRYRTNIKYEKNFKCSDGFCQENDGRVSFDTIIENSEYKCSEHNCIHSSKEIYRNWLTEEEVEDEYKVRKTMRRMLALDKETYLHAFKSGTTKRYHIRVMIVGENFAEKTCLLSRLMNEKIDDVTSSTDRLDIHRRQCKVDVETGEWFFSGAENVPYSSWSGESDKFADCVFWDFAGKKELYATHQTFLAPSAIYLLTIDISKDYTDKTDYDMTNRKFDSIGECIEFWVNNVHCYRTDVQNLSNEYKTFEELMSAVIVVGTGIDKIQESKIKEKMEAFENHVRRYVLKNKVKIVSLVILSNTQSINRLRQSIVEKARSFEIWGENIPTRWIVLENKIFRKITEKKCTMMFSELTDIAADCFFPDIRQSASELESFLNYEHNIGNIMYFHDVNNMIVLDPDWLVDVVRSFVSPELTADHMCMSELTELHEIGMLRNNLIAKIFEKVPLSTEQKDFVLQIMENFDIIVRTITDDTPKCFYMPCMMKTLTLDDINLSFSDLNVDTHNFKTSWFCLEFDILPLSFFIHLLVHFVKEFKPCMDTADRTSLYRNVGLFNIYSCGSEQLVICQSNNVIAMQVLHNNGRNHVCYSDIKNKMIDFVKSARRQYRINMTPKQTFKCSKGTLSDECGRIDHDAVINRIVYYCSAHQMVHPCSEIYTNWLTYEYLIMATANKSKNQTK